MWFLLALIYSWLYAISIEVNKHYPFDGLLTVIWRSFFATLAMALFIPFMYWPSDPVYYVVALLCVCSGIWARQRLFNIVIKHNSRVACLQLPIAIVITFIAWLAIDADEQARMLHEPIYAIGATVAIMLVIPSVMNIKKNDTSWSAIRVVAPIGFVYAFMGVFTKLVLDTGHSSFEIAVNWVFLNNIGTLMLGIPLLLRRRQKDGLDLRPKNIEKAALIGSSLHTTAWVFSALAVIYTPNPAYPAILGAMIPLWFSVYYKLFKIPDDFSPVAGTLLATSAVILLLVTL